MDCSPKEAEKEAEMYACVVRLEEVHDSYEKQLSELEEELYWVYATAVDSLFRSREEVNKEVIAVLKETESNGIVEMINLSDQEIKLLPEDFGKIVA